MDLVDHATAWAKGELIQGRVMFLYGLLLLVCFVFIWRSNHEILRGTMIPMGILICVMLGYGKLFDCKSSVIFFQNWTGIRDQPTSNCARRNG